MDLIPPAVMVAANFADYQTYIDELTTAAEEAARAVEEYTEEHAVEDGLLAAAMDDDKISKALATARLKDAKKEGSDPDEIKALQRLIELYDAEAEAKKAVKEAQTELDVAVLKEYGNLTEDDVKSLVLDDKWCAAVKSRIAGEVNSLTLDLVARIQQLGERYAETVGALDAELERLEAKVAGHLAAMGVDSMTDLAALQVGQAISIIDAADRSWTSRPHSKKLGMTSAEADTCDLSAQVDRARRSLEEYT